jgi:diguanylate cyclase (GGDEF)-like protein/PAS domain S-box-containing protein
MTRQVTDLRGDPDERSDEGPLRGDELLSVFEDVQGDVTIVCTPEGVLEYVSPASRIALGWRPDALIGCSLPDFVHPEDLPAFNAARHAVEASPTSRVATFRFRCQDGGYLWTESILRQIADPRHRGGPVLIATMRDVADRKLMEGRLQRQALTDPLTGIANRTVLMDRLDQALRRLERSFGMVAVIYLDLDHFKVINDSLGHKVGDRLLMKVAERAVAAIRPADTLARIGGDEFVVLAEGVSSIEEARQLAARVCEGMEQPFELDGESIACTVSAGVSATTDYGHSAQALVQEADLALYKAKDGGRNRAEVFDEELRSTAIGRIAVEHMIRTAIDEDRLRVHYQPIVDLRSGNVIRAEALVRIQDTDELILPDAFIDVAEETGLLPSIDEHVLSQAMVQAGRWLRERPLAGFGGVAVNVTGRDLADPRFIQLILDALDANGLEAGALAIEVTERVLMEASNSAMDCLRTIKELGVAVGLDDFGTGYSSLAYLRQFPLDFVKIDRSFIRQLLLEGSEDLAIVAAIIQLAHALGLCIVAEGVETQAQLDVLVELGCDQAQGFLFGRPEDAATTTLAISTPYQLAAVRATRRSGR